MRVCPSAACTRGREVLSEQPGRRDRRGDVPVRETVDVSARWARRVGRLRTPYISSPSRPLRLRPVRSIYPPGPGPRGPCISRKPAGQGHFPGLHRGCRRFDPGRVHHPRRHFGRLASAAKSRPRSLTPDPWRSFAADGCGHSVPTTVPVGACLLCGVWGPWVGFSIPVSLRPSAPCRLAHGFCRHVYPWASTSMPAAASPSLAQG